MAKRKMLGNIKFIAELGKVEMLHDSILHRCAEQLLVRIGFLSTRKFYFSPLEICISSRLPLVSCAILTLVLLFSPPLSFSNLGGC